MTGDERLHLLNRRLVDECSEDRLKEAEIGRRVIEHAREKAASPIEKSGTALSQHAGVRLEVIQRRHHRGKDADEQHRHFANRMKVKMVRVVNLLSGREP